MRLFIALQPDESASKKLLETIDQWKEAGLTGNYTRPENLHLTLAFLGEQPEEKRASIQQALASVPFEPMQLSVDGIGHFGSLYFANIISSPALEQYVQSVRQALKEAGIQFDAKKFKAHITLCRKLNNPDQYPLELRPFDFTIDSCCLYQSVLSPKGPTYTVLEKVTGTR